MATPRSFRARSRDRSIATPIATPIPARGGWPTRWAGSASSRASAWRRLAWNGYRHFELYYAVSGIGAIIHTINPRLFHDQLTHIVNHAGDRLVFFDLTFLPLVEKLAPVCPGVTTWIALTDRAHMPDSSLKLLCYEELLARRERRLRLARARRGNRGGTVLHVGHDRPSEGRAVQPSLDGAARDGRLPAGRQRLFGAQRHPADRPDVPRQRLGDSLLGAAGRREDRVSRRGSGRQEPVRIVRKRRRQILGRRADRLARPDPVHEAEQSQVLDASSRRRSAARLARRR